MYVRTMILVNLLNMCIHDKYQLMFLCHTLRFFMKLGNQGCQQTLMLRLLARVGHSCKVVHDYLNYKSISHACYVK